jgi:hypothetical protein
MRTLGEWRGRTRQEIEAAIAAPRAAAQLGNGATVLEWVCEGYRVFAMFDERDRCLGITRSSLSLVSSARQRLRRAPQPTTGDDAEPVLQRTGTD